MYKVFIDGAAGTTGLRIVERLSARDDLELMVLGEAERKDPEARKTALNSCDIAILCLPDAAAREAVALVENPAVCIIDASTAHRTTPGWTYGFPELSADGFARIAAAKRIANPGCHASGFLACVTPLVTEGILSPTARLSCYSLTGYSGGGKGMIADYEAAADASEDDLHMSPRIYGLGQTHKHLPEMQLVSGLAQAPVFLPVVDDYRCGMLVSVPVFAEDLCAGKTIDDVRECLAQYYHGPIVRYLAQIDEAGFVGAGALAGNDSMQLAVYGNAERFVIMARFDNLGKGASGAAVECLNIVIGAKPTTGLDL